jgi:hypothetical protein
MFTRLLVVTMTPVQLAILAGVSLAGLGCVLYAVSVAQREMMLEAQQGSAQRVSGGRN